MNLRTLASLLVTIAALAAPSLASATTTTVGSLAGDPTAAGCSAPCSRFSDNSAVPANRVLTEVRVRHAGSSAAVSVGPVRQSTEPDEWTGTSAGETAGSLDDACGDPEEATIAVRHRVAAGDRIAVHVSTTGGECGDVSFATPGGSLHEHLQSDPEPNHYDDVPDATVLLLATLETDNDDDGFGDDTQDTDDDNDNVGDTADNCQFVANTEQNNADGDVLGDVCDPDDDNDGALDGSDNCERLPNPSQANADGTPDGGDACDADDDNDGVGDSEDEFPTNAGESRDLDRDGTGDNADSDDDNDGLFDSVESSIGTDPRRADTDGDGLPDGTERRVGSDPLRADTDGDGRLDGADACPTLAAITANGCPGGSPGLTTPPLTAIASEARRLDGIDLRVRRASTRDGRRRMRVTGALDRPTGVGPVACAGRVRLTVRGAGRRLLSRRTAIRGGACSFGATLTLPRIATRLSKVTVYVAFEGNQYLLPAEGQRATITFR